MAYTVHTLWAYLDISHAMVAWSAYLGRLDSVHHNVTPDFHPISLRHATLLEEMDQGVTERLTAELRLEAVRAAEFSSQVSRLTGLYFFEDEATARRAAGRWAVPGSHFEEDFLTEVGFSALQYTRVDSEWITSEFRDPDPDWMRAYWRGVPNGSQPIWEVLAEGAGLLWGTEVRRRAWDRCSAMFPDSLLLLDVCRISQELGEFNFGRTVPIVMRADAGQLRLDYIIDFRDAHNEQMLNGLRDYRGPRNASHPVGEEPKLVVPDLKPFRKTFTLPPGTVYPLVSTVVPDHGAP
jgi:hypothetical protein